MKALLCASRSTFASNPANRRVRRRARYCCDAARPAVRHRLSHHAGKHPFLEYPRLIGHEAAVVDATGLPLDQAAMVEFLTIGAHAVWRAEVGTGDRVLVVGAGPIGVGTALLARIAGTERIVLADTQPQRFDYARGQFGFEERVVADAALADTLAAMALTRMPQLIDDADSVLKAIVSL